MTQITDISKNYLARTNAIALQAAVGRNCKKEIETLETEIDVFVRNRLNAQNIPKEIKTSIEMLGMCKSFQLSKEWLTEKFTKFRRLNLTRPEAPFQLYLMGCWPKRSGIGYYGNANENFEQSSSIAEMRLHPAQLNNLPEDVIKAIGDTKDKKVDLFISLENIQCLKKLKEHDLPYFNIITHAWAHRYYEQGKDVTEMVSMGIYEPQGVYPLETQDGVSFNGQKVLPVTLHPPGGGGFIAMSPNNAHIGINGSTLFSSFWFVAHLGQRVLASYHILKHEKDQVFEKIFSQQPSLTETLEKLKNYRQTLIKPLTDVAEGYELERAEADQLFSSLPRSLKNSIYYQTWLDKWENANEGTPAPHSDFGRAAFHGDHSLDAKYHCNGKERAALIRASCARIQQDYDQIVGQLQSLFVPPKEIAPLSEEQKEKLRLLNPIIEAFKTGHTQTGFNLFNQLDPKHRTKVYEYVWEYSNCPRNFPGDFGSASFHASPALDSNQHCDDEGRARALLCYLHSI